MKIRQATLRTNNLMLDLSCRRQAAGERRGNTIVLVAAILVLLVIVATAYITRTQAGRVTAGASQDASIRVDAANKVGEKIGDEIASALFTYPLDSSFITNNLVLNGQIAASSNTPRLDPKLVDEFGVLAPYDMFEADQQFPYVFAPYPTIPFTNPPDVSALNNIALENLLPRGPGNPGNTFGGDALHLGTGNPFGNPGHGDARYLRDIEPIRYDRSGNGVPDAYSHWRHLTNLSRPNNGWRIVRNISDITNVAGLALPGGLVENLEIPVEQWPEAPLTRAAFFSDDRNFQEEQPFFAFKWDRWFGTINGDLDSHVFLYNSNATAQPNSPPVNFYRLRDLNGDGVIHGSGERPEDEFNEGSLRHTVSQVLTDTDGDGYTDAFWHLAPLGMDNGIRHLVAVSIVDNNAMMNVNVGTAFSRTDNGFRTLGLTPTDLALIGENADTSGFDYDVSDGGTWEVGFYDIPNHERHNNGGLNDFPGSDYSYDYLPTRWTRHAEQMGWIDNGNNVVSVLNQFERLMFWRHSASFPPVNGRTDIGPWTTNPNNFLGPYTPFNIENEIELRLYASQNSEWIYTPYEWSVQATGANETEQFLRAGQGIPETVELAGQLPNRERANDMRQRLTMYNGARNEILAPWLWFRFPTTSGGIGTTYLPEAVQIDGNNFGTNIAERNFLDQQRLKIDLRESRFRDRRYAGFGANVDDNYLPGQMLLHDRLPFALMMALTDDTVPATWNNPLGYYGDVTSQVDKHRRLAAAYAANILNYRDSDVIAPLFWDYTGAIDPNFQQYGHAVTLPKYGTVDEDKTIGYLGMEPQPFLMEAFIAHVHGSEPVPPASNLSGLDQGNYVDNDATQRTTIVVVQIANPYDFPIDLRDYQIRVYGELVDLNVVADAEVGAGNPYWLEPATEEAPRTAIFYSIANDLNNPSGPSGGGANTFKSRWVDFLDIASVNHPLGTVIADVTNVGWSLDRDAYDSPAGIDTFESSVELVRTDFSHPVNATPSLVVVDRFGLRPGAGDPDETDREDDFFEAVSTTLRDQAPPPIGSDVANNVSGIRIRNNNTYATWARANRAWSLGPDSIPVNPNERNPRYIFHRYDVQTNDTSDSAYTGPYGDEPDDPTYITFGETYEGIAFEDFDGDPDANSGAIWFDEEFVYGPDTLRRKVTFFDHMFAFDGSDRAIYDGAWDTTYPGGPVKTFPDEGFVGTVVAELNFPLQMNWRDADFLRIGEVLDVWLYGHEVEFQVTNGPDGFPIPDTYEGTTKTFAEHMDDPELVGTGPLVNRLFTQPTTVEGGEIQSPVIGIGETNNLLDDRHAMPNLPAGLRVLDLFTLDDGGYTPGDFDGDGNFNTPADTDLARLNLAGEFKGRITPGLVNLNTATVQVMRTMPHMYKVVREFFGLDIDGIGPSLSFGTESADEEIGGGSMANRDWTRCLIPESIVQYRERFPQTLIDSFPASRQFLHGEFNGPDYSNREQINGEDLPDIRGDRGMASTAEVLLLREPGFADDFDPYTGMPRAREAWTVNFGESNNLSINRPPFRLDGDPTIAMPMAISTDVSPRPRANFDYERIPSEDILNNIDLDLQQDPVAGDAEEMNLLYSGISNLATTRSDVFTVYFRIRSVKQDPITGRWNALDRDLIVDDTRYVMLIDRSNVNEPTDKPKIIYMQKLPN